MDNVTKVCEVPKIKIEDPITLDDILNLWDGIRETPGRILIITSNHYDKLDPALKRPGRIDITLELANASRNVVGDIYKHLTDEFIDPNVLEQIPDKKYSPAEIMNFYMAGDKNEEAFLSKLLVPQSYVNAHMQEADVPDLGLSEIDKKLLQKKITGD